MKCDFEVTPLDDGRYRHACKLPGCGAVVITAAKRHIQNCPRFASVQPAPPPFGKRLANFSVAAIGHLLAGCPACTQEQIDERYAVCVTCPLYRPDKHNPDVGICTHEKCGCGVSREQKFITKLGWLDGACPLGKWPSIQP